MNESLRSRRLSGPAARLGEASRPGRAHAAARVSAQTRPGGERGIGDAGTAASWRSWGEAAWTASDLAPAVPLPPVWVRQVKSSAPELLMVPLRGLVLVAALLTLLAAELWAWHLIA